MLEVMIALGKFRFSVETAAWDTLNFSSSYRWPSQARFGRAPALQYTGPDEQKITLSGTIYPGYRGGLEQIAGMRAIAYIGQPQLLSDGRGGIHGRWVITDIGETRSFLLPNGAPRKVEFNMTLKFYGEDRRR
jgi:uncharacterized protein